MPLTKALLHKKKQILAADIKLDNATAAKKLVPAKKVRLYLPRNPFSREDHVFWRACHRSSTKAP